MDWNSMELQFHSIGSKFSWIDLEFNWWNNMMWIDAQDIENMLVTFIIHNYGVEKKWNDTNLKRHLINPNSHKILKQNLFW
jgi:hypothetical protein